MVFVLQNTNGLEAHISTYGCMLMRFIAPDKEGRLENIVLGLNKEEDYKKANTNYGGIVGRYANRISGGGFELDGTFYPLPINLNGNMHLHGGISGFDQKEWTVIFHNTNQITLQYQSADGEEGYPGNLLTTVNYLLREDNSLEFSCEATTDRPTVVSLSHHAYFNLSGSLTNNIKDHQLWLDAMEYLETNKDLVPKQAVDVTNTPFDFRKEKPFGDSIYSKNAHIQTAGGYDHCFIIRAHGDVVKKAATLWHPDSGRLLELETNKPGLQLYTANFLAPETIDSQGVPLRPYHAVCLEPQHFPDAPNRPDFPSPVLRPGEIYRHKTIFRLSIR